MTLQNGPLKTDSCFSPYQSVNGFPWCLRHLQLVQDSWEDGAILSPVDLQRARAHDLDTVLVQGDCQVVWNLAPDWYDTATARLKNMSSMSASGQWTAVLILPLFPFWQCWMKMTAIFSLFPSMDILLCHKEVNGLSPDFPGTYLLKSL